jgi:hypothetical protein
MAECGQSASLLLRIAEGATQLGQQAFGALSARANLCDLPRCGASPPPEEENSQREKECGQRERADSRPRCRFVEQSYPSPLSLGRKE